MQNKQSCFRCGKDPSHSRERCPARNSTCNKCSKVGHWAKVCRNKVVAEIFKENGEGNTNYEFLGEITSKDNAQWRIDLKLNGEKLQFKMDTGADETRIPYITYDSMRTKLPVLQKTQKKLHSCDGKKLNICGKFNTTIEAEEKIIVQEVYVIKGLHQALLGGPAIYAVNLLKKEKFVDAVNSTDEVKLDKEWKSMSPKLFKGL